MRYRTTRLLLALALVFGLTLAVTGEGAATNHEGPTELYFPWVPHGAMLGDSGPYHGSLTIQNLESSDVSIYALPMSELGGPEPPMLEPWTLGPHASITLSPSEIGIGDGVPGSAVTVSGEFVDGGEPARIAGVLKQAAPEPPSSDARTGSAHATVGGYTGIMPGQLDTDAVLPVVQTNSDWNTVIRVGNVDESETANTVRLALHEAGGSSAPVVFTEVLGAGETATFDLLQRGVEPGWVGSAVITADANIGAVAERVKPATNMLIMNQSRPVNAGGPHAPLMLREWSNWNTGISVANLSDDVNEVTVDYYRLDGELVDSDEITVPPRGMQFIFTPAGDTGSGDETTGFVGSARISGDFPLHAVVDQVKYFGDDDDTGHAMSYVTERRPGSRSYLVAPLAQKGNSESGIGDTTGIQLVETIGAGATVKLWFLDQLGNIVSPEPEVIDLGPREGYTAYAMFYDYLPSGFQGSAVIRAMEGEVVAASNYVNYAVQYDGSASMNLIPSRNLHSAFEIDISASPNPVPHYDRSSLVSATVYDRLGEPFPSGHAVIFSMDDTSQAGINFGPGAPYGSSGPVTTDDSGTASQEVQIRDEALGDRPVEATVTLSAGDLEEQVTITWQPPPELAPPGS